MMNKYFDHFSNTPEQDLYAELINETVDQYGIESFYIPRDTQSRVDLVFGDDPTKIYNSNYPVQIYVDTVEGFGGPQYLYSKFGGQIQKTANFLITKDMFDNQLGGVLELPRAGDLLWLSNFQALFEITFVNQDHFFYAFGNTKFFGWMLSCEMYRYSNEPVQTGIEEIDTKINEVVIAYSAQVASNANSATFIPPETVYQGSNLSAATASASVIGWDRPTGTLSLKNIVGSFTPNVIVHGVLSEAAFRLVSIDLEQSVNDGQQDNARITEEIETNVYINTNESNPLQGDPQV